MNSAVSPEPVSRLVGSSAITRPQDPPASARLLLAAPAMRTSLPSRDALHALGHHHVAAGERRVDQHRLGVALDDAHRHALDLAVATVQTKAPSEPHSTASGLTAG